jgi:ADP-ribose pyrophosphatase YjhB (NUDIX family)
MMKFVDVFPYAQTDNGLCFLLLKRGQENTYPGIWQPVAGKIKAGETAWEAGYKKSSG